MDYETLFGRLNKDFLLFCHSYPIIQPVIKVVNDLLKREYRGKIRILTPFESIDIFLKMIFKTYDNVEIIYIGKKTKIQKRIRGISWLKEYYDLRKIRKNVSSETNLNVVFFSRAYAVREYYILNALKARSNNRTFYINYVDFYNKYGRFTKEHLSLAQQIRAGILKMLYGKNLTYYKRGMTNTFAEMIDDRFMQDIDVINVEGDIFGHDKEIEKYKVKTKYKIIYFDDKLGPEYIDQDSFKKTVCEMFEQLHKIGLKKEEIGVKYHPGSSCEDKSDKLLKYGTEISRYIPSEFLKIENCKAIISGASNSLHKKQDTAIKKISLIDIYGWNNKEAYWQFRNGLIKQCGEELFIPKTMIELVDIVSKII